MSLTATFSGGGLNPATQVLEEVEAEKWVGTSATPGNSFDSVVYELDVSSEKYKTTINNNSGFGNWPTNATATKTDSAPGDPIGQSTDDGSDGWIMNVSV